jgi:hypothetical protein
LPAETKEPLLGKIGRLIDDGFGGPIVKLHRSELWPARR